MECWSDDARSARAPSTTHRVIRVLLSPSPAGKGLDKAYQSIAPALQNSTTPFAFALSVFAAPEILRPMNFTKNIGMLLLAIYLILAGLMSLAGFAIPGIVMGILALAAGICILIGK